MPHTTHLQAQKNTLPTHLHPMRSKSLSDLGCALDAAHAGAPSAPYKAPGDAHETFLALAALRRSTPLTAAHSAASPASPSPSPTGTPRSRPSSPSVPPAVVADAAGTEAPNTPSPQLTRALPPPPTLTRSGTPTPTPTLPSLPPSQAASPAPGAPDTGKGPDVPFGDKLHNFTALLKDRPAYRRTMLAAWAHTAGNGVLNASYMTLLASIGGASPSRSFLAIAIKDLGQSAVFSAVNILGSHRIDGARPVDELEDARRRRGFLSELKTMCWADAGIAAGLLGVGSACRTGLALPLLLTGSLVGLRLLLACKAVYEMSLFPCVRQLLGKQTLGDLIAPADRMIPSLEATVSMLTYEAVSCTVQFIIFAQGASFVVPCAMGAAVGGALLSAAPKWLLHRADSRAALTPTAAPTDAATRPSLEAEAKSRVAQNAASSVRVGQEGPVAQT